MFLWLGFLKSWSFCSFLYSFIFHSDQIFILFLSFVKAIFYPSNPSIWSIPLFHSITLLILFQFIWKQLRPRRPMCLLSPISPISFFSVSNSLHHPSLPCKIRLSWRNLICSACGLRSSSISWGREGYRDILCSSNCQFTDF